MPPTARTLASGPYTGAELPVSRQGHVATLTIHRPEKRNAMTAAMWAGLPGVLGGLAGDPAVRVLVVTRAGHDQHPDGGVVREVGQDAGERRPHRRRHRVPLLGPVDGQGGDVSLPGHRELVGHSQPRSSVANVSHWFGSPVWYPVMNHFCRCSDEPCVKEFWSTRPLPRFSWMKSSPIRPAARSGTRWRTTSAAAPTTRG